ncbi:LysM domain-containing protein, partial [Halobacillus sp. BBL2006]|uniref:LysM peptidoglycan-binding domain-containing protein n=1 Tax=Halobacillus sp. BBL2006 TaxID=1543706 RepID=UPI0005439407
MNKKKLATAVCGTLMASVLWGTSVFADQTYKVSSGDTLWGISMKHSTTVSKLKSWNNLNTDLIFIGQQLVVNKSSTAPTQPDSSSGTNDA